MPSEQERRSSGRTRVSADAFIVVEGRLGNLPARVLNVSTGGARIALAASVDVGQKLRLLLKTTQGDWCPILARVVETGRGEISIHFTTLGPIAANVVHQLIASQLPTGEYFPVSS